MAIRSAVFLLTLSALAPAQPPTLKDLMLDLIHPASNDLLLTINRNGPSTDQEWRTARSNALALMSSEALLAQQINSEAWRKAVKQFSDAGADAYRAAKEKDVKALTEATTHIDASCTNCHKQFRPNVFPPGRY